jgi:endoglucanase
MFKTILSACVGAALLVGVFAGESAQGADNAAPAAGQSSEAMAFARQMGIGWNLGNTLEATGIKGTSVREFETCWGNPVTTKAMIDGIKAAGFNSIRIPVAWSNLMGPDYTISKDLMARVEEVARYALDDDMYVIINIHWDGGWFKKFPTDYDESMRKYKAVWTQISAHFKDYSDHLIFESLNEELSFHDLWNPYNGAGQKEKAFEIANNINQAFTDVVRESGGNNARRYLLIAGYETNIDHTTGNLFKMPHDPARHSMISVHYYDPPTFAILEQDASWGKAARTWGTPKEIEHLNNEMAKMKKFTDQGVPVVVGEFGCPDRNKEQASVAKYISTVCETAYQMGYVPMLWDAGGQYDRKALKFRNPQIGEAMTRIAAMPRP